MCGTENGYIKIIDIESEKVLSRARINSNYISDVKENIEVVFNFKFYCSVFFSF